MRPVRPPSIGEVFHEVGVSEELDPTVLRKRERRLINPEAGSAGAAGQVCEHLRSRAVTAAGGVGLENSEVDISTAG